MGGILMEKNEANFSHILKNNPSGYILRRDLTEKTGGLLHGRTMANLDCLGKGISGRIMIKNRVAYPVQAVVEYLQKIVRVVDGN